MIEQLADEIWKELQGRVESLYLGGSRAVGAETESSDYDFFGIVNEKYDFNEEKELNGELSEKYGEEIRFRGISLGELKGGDQKGIITEPIPLPVVLKSFPNWKHLKGKKHRLEDFEVEPASPEEEADFYVETLEKFRENAEKNKIPFPFEDYVKNVLRLIGAEEQMEGEDFTQDFEKIAEGAPEHAEELAEICIRFRRTGEMDKERFFELLDEYLDYF